MEARKKLVEAKRRAEERSAEAKCLAMEVYKELTDFTMKKARAMVAFKISKEFYNDGIAFIKEAF